MEEQYKEAYFAQHCRSCEYKNLDELEEPCDECLEKPMNLYSHKPVNYKKDEKASVKKC